MNEHSYIDSVTKKLKPSYQWKINDSFAAGIPDSFYEGKVRDLWVEYKYIGKFPKRDTTYIDLTNPNKFLSKQQQLWIKRRHYVRRDVWVIVGSEHGACIFEGLDWEQPIRADVFKHNVRTTNEVAKHILGYINADF